MQQVSIACFLRGGGVITIGDEKTLFSPHWRRYRVVVENLKRVITHESEGNSRGGKETGGMKSPVAEGTSLLYADEKNQ